MAPNGFTGPTYNTTGLGGKPALTFAGGNATGMRTTADVVTIGTGSASSIFTLASFTSGSIGGPYIAGNGQVATPTQSANSWLMSLVGSTPDIEAACFGSFWCNHSSTQHRTAPWVYLGLHQRHGLRQRCSGHASGAQLQHSRIA